MGNFSPDLGTDSSKIQVVGSILIEVRKLENSCWKTHAILHHVIPGINISCT
ncbi:hypothetical protein X975_24451, partial [Stegodyphus mimosarum]